MSWSNKMTQVTDRKDHHHMSNWFCISSNVSYQKPDLDMVDDELQMQLPWHALHAQVRIESGSHEHLWELLKEWWHYVTSGKPQSSQHHIQHPRYLIQISICAMYELCTTSGELKFILVSCNPILTSFVFNKTCMRNIKVPNLQWGCTASKFNFHDRVIYNYTQLQHDPHWNYYCCIKVG